MVPWSQNKVPVSSSPTRSNWNFRSAIFLRSGALGRGMGDGGGVINRRKSVGSRKDSLREHPVFSAQVSSFTRRNLSRKNRMLSQATRKRTNKKVNPPLTCSVLKSGTPRKHGTVGKKVKRKTHLSSISGYLSRSGVRFAIHNQPGTTSPLRNCCWGMIWFAAI